MKKVAFVIVNFNGCEDTLLCLSSLTKMKIPEDVECSIYVVDNASDITTEKIAHFMFPVSNSSLQYFYIQSDINMGFSGGNNIGIKKALADGNDYIGLLNNDTLVDIELLSQLLDGFTDSNIGIVVPKIYFMKGFEYHKDKYKKEDLGKVIWYAGGVMDWENVIGSHRGVDEIDSGQFDKPETTEFATGCCMMAKRKVWEEVGFLDEKYFLYYEDSDYSTKVKKQNYTIMYYPKAFLYHKNAGSTGGSGSSLQDYYITRNRLLFGLRYAPYKTKLHLVIESIRLLQKGRTWQKRGVNDFYRKRFGQGTYSKN